MDDLNFTKEINSLTLHELLIGYKTQAGITTLFREPVNEGLKCGEFVCLLGRNGSGKSTLLRTLAGLLKPIQGNINCFDRWINEMTNIERSRKIGLVLTEKIALGMLNVRDVVAYGRYPYTNWLGKLSREDLLIIDNSIQFVGISHLTHKLVYELSDGELQKVMIARALAQDTPILILDEITSFLDLPSKIEIFTLLRKLASQNQKAVITSSHDFDLALGHADRIWMIGPDQEFLSGGPEDLILSNAFENLYANKVVQFSQQEGSFQLIPSFHHTVSLDWDENIGEAYIIWTQRGLKRRNVKILNQRNPQTDHIHIRSSGKGIKWELINAKDSFIFSSLYELFSSLDKIF